jgi:hypothetical protein
MAITEPRKAVHQAVACLTHGHHQAQDFSSHAAICPSESFLCPSNISPIYLAVLFALGKLREATTLLHQLTSEDDLNFRSLPTIEKFSPLRHLSRSLRPSRLVQFPRELF